MKNALKLFLLAIVGFVMITPAMAMDFNLFNVNIGSPQNQLASQMYGKAFDFPPEQVAPALLGPQEEVPAVLQIAQAAGTIPMTVWMMRRMGMSYSNILSTFSLAPTALMGAPGGFAPSPYYGAAPFWGTVSNPFYVEVARSYFLRNILGVDPLKIAYIPTRGLDFTRYLLTPYNPIHGYWLPPGQAKKLGLWLPPGQAKKIGWGPWGQPYAQPYGKSGWKGDDDGKGHGKSKSVAKGDDDDHGGKGKGNHGNGGSHGGGKGKGKSK